MKKPIIASVIAVICFIAAGLTTPLVFVALAPMLHAQLPDVNGGDDLTKAIVKYPYTWEHDTVHYKIIFNADGTGRTPKTDFNWHVVNAHQIEIIHFSGVRPDQQSETVHITFSQDYSTYTGTFFDASTIKVNGHQLISDAQGDKPQTPKPSRGGSNPFGSKTQGADSSQAQAPPSASISPEMQQKAADLVKACHNDLVFVTGKEGAGSGFIAVLGKSNLLFTNAHVAAGITNAGFKTLDDTAVQSGAASVAVGRDVFSIAQPAGGAPLEIMQDVDTNAGIGDEVVVLGNAGGQGVINTITGRIVGVGGDRVEVDAPFVPGNSGSPIIHLKTGKVIGVATYLVVNNYDLATSEKNARPVIRRFGYRLDNIKQWQTVDWRSFYAQAAEMEKIETLTGDLGDFFRDLGENKGGVTPGRHTNPVIKNRIDQWLADRSGNRSGADIGIANENFLSFLKVACQADVTAGRQHMSYDYFQRELVEQQQIRDQMSRAFAGIIKDISK